MLDRNEVINVDADSALSFGNYSVKEKQKVSNFDVNGDIYNIKTHKDITRLEKNNKLLYESVPGTKATGFKITDKCVTFTAFGFTDSQITLELEPEKEYGIVIDNINVGSAKSNMSGKVNFSIELDDTPKFVKIEKM